MVGGNKRMRNNIVPHKFIEQSKSSSMNDAPSMDVDQLGTETMNFNIAKLRLDQISGSITDNLNSECTNQFNFNIQEDYDKNRSNICDDRPAIGSQKLNVGVQVKIKSLYRSVKVQCKPVTKDRPSSPIEQLIENENAHNYCSQPTNNDPLSNPSPNTTNLSSNTTASSFPTSSDNFLTTNGSTENEWKNTFQQEEFQKRNLKQTRKNSVVTS
ncbi:metabotropic glutamate receptor-like protein P [Cotesia glomerata]|uniref:metabotropic glutamate receptor-like protein P n=1 Tax=Cotesia glomerata TaxID=32391 RepID=UPI001D01DBE0|nr:metabotropic glutamate receptor-like protein P [Cotesia glomerata]